MAKVSYASEAFFVICYYSESKLALKGLCGKLWEVCQTNISPVGSTLFGLFCD